MTSVEAGVDMFARYAEAPNRLGYCGPAEAATLRSGSRDEIARAARQFTGVWPYLRVLAEMTGIADPLDHQVVDAYWIGGGLGAQVDPREFARRLLAIVAPQAGHYWAHLTEDLVDEAAPNHCFHVLGVYPWTRLLGRTPGIPAEQGPLSILDHCRIAWATVVSTDGVTAEVSGPRLRFGDGALSLTDPVTRSVQLWPGLGDLAPGDVVAVHWDRVCDRLDPDRRDRLEAHTVRQLEVTNRRLRNRAS